MIAILADDFSGAAELAGIAAVRGYKTEVQTRFDPTSDAEVIAVDTDTRLMPEAAAARIVSDVARQILAAQPARIFKNTDSVLRGHIRAELEAILDTTGQHDCLFIPANPSKGCIITAGRYFVNGVPLDQTDFAHDPDHPRHSSLIADMLGHAPHIQVPDVATLADIELHVSRLTAQTLAAGATIFFSAWLPVGRAPAAQSALPSTRRAILLCGSLAAWGTGRAEQAAAHGMRVRTLPQQFIAADDTQSAFAAWGTEIVQEFHSHPALMIALGHLAVDMLPAQLMAWLTEVMQEVLRQIQVDRLFIEGGATAAALLQSAGWHRFEANSAPLTGIGVLRPLTAPCAVLS